MEKGLGLQALIGVELESIHFRTIPKVGEKRQASKTLTRNQVGGKENDCPTIRLCAF